MPEEEKIPTRSEMVNMYMAAANEAVERLYTVTARLAALTRQGENIRPHIHDSVRQAQLNVKLTSMWLVDIAAQTENIIAEEDGNEALSDQQSPD